MTAVRFYFTLFFLCSIMSSAFAGSWAGFDQGFREAKAKKLPVIVDFSADWCGWCKKMDAETFSRPDVAARLAAETVTVRLDADSDAPLTYRGKTMTSRQFASAMRVDGLPTLMVFDAQGNKLTELIGFADAKHFLFFLDYVKKGCYRKISFEQYMRAGGDCR